MADQQSFAAGLVGIVLDGRYRLDALLGEGGMGAVYRAYHLAMERKVAVKLLKPHLTNDDVALQRFAREARSTLRVDSPHAVKVLDFGVTPLRDYYMVLEYLDGRTVQRELDVDGPFAPARVLHIAKQALHALGAAHKIGLVHRDIKPDNILLMTQGDDADYAKLLDFGVAKLMEGAPRSAKSALSLTQTGMVFGTPEFMSPEQACGQSLDGRSDLYSLAATMFAMLTGRGMYMAKSPIEWLTAHARQPAPHLADGLPALGMEQQLDGVLQRCLAKRRDDRPQTAEDMARLLDEVATGGTPTAPGKSIAIAKAVTPVFSPSTFVETIADPSLAIAQIDTLPPAGTGMHDPLPRRGRGLWIALGALAVVGVVAAAIVVASRTGLRPQASGLRRPTTNTKVVDAPTDATTDSAIDAGASEPDARGLRSEASPDAGVAKPRPANPAIAKHLAAAETAREAGKRVKQIAEADAALHLDPHNVRAMFLLADGLIASGDLDHGCKYLRELGRNPTAIERARQAGCPTN